MLAPWGLPAKTGCQLAKKASLCPTDTKQSQGVKNPPREAMMNHITSGYPLPLSHANKPQAFSLCHSHTPTWQPPSQPYPPPQCHPTDGTRGAQGDQSSRHWQRLPERALMQIKGASCHLWAWGPRRQIPGWGEACSAGSYSWHPCPCHLLRARLQNQLAEIYAMKLLPQRHVTSPVDLSGAN